MHGSNKDWHRNGQLMGKAVGRFVRIGCTIICASLLIGWLAGAVQITLH